MDTIFVVSPCYLESAYKEALKYDFVMQGYGTFEAALHGILKVNAADIIGFAYLGRALPAKGSHERKAMISFLQICELMEADKKFVFAVDNGVSSNDFQFSKFKQLRFFAAPHYDFMSDVVINQQVFGSLLLDNYTPYKFQNEKEDTIPFVSPKLEYVPLFSDALIQCISNTEKLDTLERTLDLDSVYRRFKSEKSDLQYFRKYYVAKLFSDYAALDECRGIIDDILTKYETDPENWCALSALKRYVEDKQWTTS